MLWYSIPPDRVTFLLCVAAFLLLVRLALWLRPNARHMRHWRKQRQARRILDKINQIAAPGRRLAYLRKIDPLTFEELLLEAFKQRGHRIYRNKRYTGDGGIDGAVFYDGKLHLIQAKRYTSHIDRAHIVDFCKVLDRRDCHGFFCHTGKTGKGSQQAITNHPRLTLVSGDRLLELFDRTRWT